MNTEIKKGRQAIKKGLCFDGKDWSPGRYYDARVEALREKVWDAEVDIRALAGNLGVTKQHLSNCLRGHYRLTARMEKQILEFLGTPVYLNEIL